MTQARHRVGLQRLKGQCWIRTNKTQEPHLFKQLCSCSTGSSGPSEVEPDLYHEDIHERDRIRCYYRDAKRLILEIWEVLGVTGRTQGITTASLPMNKRVTVCNKKNVLSSLLQDFCRFQQVNFNSFQ